MRAVARFFLSRQRWHIVVKRLDVPDAGDLYNGAADLATECLVVDSPRALRAVAPEIRAAFRDSVPALHARLAQGCVVCLLRRPTADGTGKEVIGYEVVERGVFAAFGRRTPLARDVVFSHYVEVLPAYRGQRLHRLLSATRDAYFRRRAGRLLCGVVPAEDVITLRALGRAGHTVAGTVTRVAMFRALTLWRTPMEQIERSLGRGGDPRLTAASRGAA